jgi:hypothetical protein
MDNEEEKELEEKNPDDMDFNSEENPEKEFGVGFGDDFGEYVDLGSDSDSY